jgi:GntR family transcriptional regulator
VIHTTSRTIAIDPVSPLPIWKQIEDGIRRLVASAALKPNAAVPSVRELAGDLQVNPATVSRAYQHLVDQGILVVRRGDGTYVASEPPTKPSAERHRELKEAALRFASSAVTLGSTEEQAIAETRAAFRSLGGGERKER